MEKVSQVGKELRRKSGEMQRALAAELHESLKRLERSLIELSSDRLSTISYDISQKLGQSLGRIEERSEKLNKAIFQLHKQRIEAEGEKWRKLILFLFLLGLILGLTLGSLAALHFRAPAPAPVVVKENQIVRSSDGTRYLPVSAIPNLIIKGD